MSISMQDMIKMGRVQFQPSFRTWNYLSTKIVIVGCGGTGGRIVPTIAQHVANHNRDVQMETTGKMYLKHNLELILIDMDIVEPKNLKRQNFYAFDVGKNKAQCLAERYSALYGIDIEYFPTKFDEAKSLINGDNVIFFDCTDNIKARQSIEAYNKSAVLISCGNEDTFGQVIVSSIVKHPEDAMFRKISELDAIITGTLDRGIDNSKNLKKVDYLPSLLNMHPDFKDTETVSCTEMEIVNEQSMPINSLVAQLAYNVFYDIISGVPLKYNVVKCSVENSFTTSFINTPLSYVELLLNTITRRPFNIANIKVASKFLRDYNFDTWRLRSDSAESIIGKIQQSDYKDFAYGIASLFITMKQDSPAAIGQVLQDQSVTGLYEFRNSFLEVK